MPSIHPYTLKQCRPAIENWRAEAAYSTALADRLEAAVFGSSGGHVFCLSESDIPAVLFVGDTVHTKYGDELVVTRIIDGDYTSTWPTFEYEGVNALGEKVDSASKGRAMELGRISHVVPK